jgi:hypothetical protein
VWELFAALRGLSSPGIEARGMGQAPALYYALWPSWFPRTLYAGSPLSENIPSG